MKERSNKRPIDRPSERTNEWTIGVRKDEEQTNELMNGNSQNMNKWMALTKERML